MPLDINSWTRLGLDWTGLDWTGLDLLLNNLLRPPADGCITTTNLLTIL